MLFASHWRSRRFQDHHRPRKPLVAIRSFVLFSILTMLLLQAVFDVDRQAGKLTLIETAPGVTVEELKSKTGASFSVSPDLKQM